MNWHQALEAWDFERIDRDVCECKMTWCRYRVTISSGRGRWFAELSCVVAGQCVTLACVPGPSKGAAFKELLKQTVGTAERVTVADLIVPADFDLGGIE